MLLVDHSRDAVGGKALFRAELAGWRHRICHGRYCMDRRRVWRQCHCRPNHFPGRLHADAREFRVSQFDQPSNASSEADSNSGPNAPVPPGQSTDDQTLPQFRSLVYKKVYVDFSLATREQLAPDAADLRRQLDLLRPKYQADPLFAELSSAIGNFEKKVLALPSGKFDPAVFQDAADADDWTTGNLSRGRMAAEVSVGAFKFQPPLDMTFDLHSSEESEGGLAWIDPSAPGVRIAVSSRPRPDPKQRRPVISDQPAVIHSAQTNGLLAVDGACHYRQRADQWHPIHTPHQQRRRSRTAFRSIHRRRRRQ